MTSNTRRIVMAAIGAYLIYSGVTLVRDTMTGKPENETLFIAVGVFFAIFGFVTILFNLKAFVKETKAEMTGLNTEEPDAAEEPEMESSEEKEDVEKKVVDIHLDSASAEEKPASEKDSDNEEEKAAVKDEEDSKEETETDEEESETEEETEPEDTTETETEDEEKDK